MRSCPFLSFMMRAFAEMLRRVHCSGIELVGSHIRNPFISSAGYLPDGGTSLYKMSGLLYVLVGRCIRES